MAKLKLRLVVLSLVAIMVTFFTQGTLAYYSTVGKATNVITSGDIKLAIHEKTETGEDFPTDGVYIIPGDIVGKKVTIENVCEHPFYLRVKIVYGIDSQELSAEDCFKLNLNEENWKLHDGWYYYNGIVTPGQTTPYVFSKVEMVGNKIDNSYIGKTLSLTVKAQAVQSENNPLNEGEPIHSITGWPTESEAEQ